VSRRSAGLRLRLLLTLAGAGMLVGGLLVAALLWILRAELGAGTVRAHPGIAGSVVVIAAAAGAILVALLGWLLDRQLVSPLSRVDAALERVSGASPTEPLLPEGGDLIGRVAPAINRLEQRLAEERVRVGAAREEAARAERLASVGRLAAGVAHEVGNPMTALIGFLALLRERLASGEDAGPYVDRIENEASRIDRILRDLLSLARPPDRLGPVDLRLCAAQAVAIVRGQPKWTPSVELRMSALPPAAGDEHYLVQVLVNLLVNSAKAGSRAIEMVGRVENGAVLLEVIDDGRGLPADQLDRLFEPFFTTAAPGEGTGLGLALCHATMASFGGSIEARPAPGGRGASFLLRFRPWE
jgi:signal transduction histidine kinase